MLLSELVENIRTDYLDDTESSKYLSNDAFMVRSFNEAQRQACNRTNFLYEEFSIILVDGIASYTLDNRITKIEHVLFDGLEVIKRSPAEFDYSLSTWRTDTGMTGKDVSYVIRGNKIRFVPSPIAADDGKTVTIEAYVLPRDKFISLNDEPVIPEEFHRDLIYWVLHEALSKRDEDRFNIKAVDYLNRFESVFGRYVSAQVRQHQLENGLSLIGRPFNYNNTASRTNADDNW